MLNRRSKTYSRSFTGYFIDKDGNQVKLFQTFIADDVERLCKEFVCRLPYDKRLYIEELFVMHYISTYI